MVAHVRAAESASTMGSALRSGRTTSVALIERALARIEADNGALNAFVLVDRAGALASARQADRELERGHDRGPLHGIPIAVKDIFDVRGLPTGCGTNSRFGHAHAQADADVVERLRAAGAVIVGKTTMHEFAYGATGDRSAQGPSRNPHDPTRISGGSSGGSAVAVASGMVPLALGTDTAGSVRVPAALCGIVGFKPAFEDLSTRGVFPLAPGLDHVGLFANTVDDAELLYTAISERPRLPRHVQVDDLTVGWLVPETFTPADLRVTSTAYQALAASALRIERVDMSGRAPEARTLFSYFSAIQSRQAYEIHADHLEADAELIDPEVVARLRAGRDVGECDYADAEAVRVAFTAEALRLLETVKILALPTVGVTAPLIDVRRLRVGDVELETRATLLALTSPWNLAGVPAMSIPAGLVSGLPCGLQLIAAPGNEQLLFDAARRIETAHCDTDTRTGN